MDIAAFKVSHSVEIDKDATALRAARARSSSIGAMEEMSHRRFKMQAPTPKSCAHPRHTVNSAGYCTMGTTLWVQFEHIRLTSLNATLS